MLLSYYLVLLCIIVYMVVCLVCFFLIFYIIYSYCYYVEIKCQLDATDDFYCRSYCLLNMFRAPLFPSSGAREYYTEGCCLWYLVLRFSSCRYGAELKVMCPVCGLQPANRTHNPQHISYNQYTTPSTHQFQSVYYTVYTSVPTSTPHRLHISFNQYTTLSTHQFQPV